MCKNPLVAKARFFKVTSKGNFPKILLAFDGINHRFVNRILPDMNLASGAWYIIYKNVADPTFRCTQQEAEEILGYAIDWSKILPKVKEDLR